MSWVQAIAGSIVVVLGGIACYATIRIHEEERKEGRRQSLGFVRPRLK